MLLNFQSFENDATFCGIGGAWDAPFPWKTFKKRDWFQAAVIVVSLGVRYLEKIIPGYRNCEQNFINEYIGMYNAVKNHIYNSYFITRGSSPMDEVDDDEEIFK